MGYRCADVALFTSKWLASVLDGQIVSLVSLYYFSSFSHPLLLILYNSWYAGVYLYWRCFASSINIVGGDSPGNYSKKITC
jgi:hypothetical protein